MYIHIYVFKLDMYIDRYSVYMCVCIYIYLDIHAYIQRACPRLPCLLKSPPSSGRASLLSMVTRDGQNNYEVIHAAVFKELALPGPFLNIIFNLCWLHVIGSTASVVIFACQVTLREP